MSAGGALNSGGGGAINIGGGDGIGGAGGETAIGGSGGTPLGYEIEMISVDSNGILGNGASSQPSINYDATVVSYFSLATNLIPGGVPASKKGQVYRRDRPTKQTKVVSVDDNGVLGNYPSSRPFVSGNGVKVSFCTHASNLGGSLPPLGSPEWLYIRDESTSKTFLGSVNSLGEPEQACTGFGSERNPLSFDGSSLFYVNDSHDVVSRNLNTNARTVLFSSTEPVLDLFLTPNDQYLAYRYPNSGNPLTYVYDLPNNAPELISVPYVAPIGPVGSSTYSLARSVSADGRYAVFDLPKLQDQRDIYLRDRQDGNTTYIAEGRHPQITSSGRFIAYEKNVAAFPGELLNVAVYDRETGITRWIGQWGYGSTPPVQAQSPYWSGDGNYLAFTSWSPELVSGDDNNTIDVFVVGVYKLWE